ncbi:MAG: class I SAM-dependent methyltransferase [Methylobacterium sp.]|nr:class I SAM-dependent methyltransferase [Rhodobacter sp.]MCA3649193.1 class I SAM-dependent methyltransferase [Methylobacterium sp.]MCA3654010.1 class I SAM-dependent methyltransferase [Methylobacterium sp.]MCA3657795.1 class I SAM-dependent methyltransferase [Methylobacterium sp.]MCA3660624.1 class I SAM-dependent methyltransferase [Methylobacterium sp.]
MQDSSTVKDVSLSTITKAYEKWAPFYDRVYHKMLRPSQLKAVSAAMENGPRVLEVGVGSGLALGYYPPEAQVTGIDLSKPMLHKAEEKIAAQGLKNVTGLAVMDACRLGFRDGTFDAVAGMFMITLVPDAEAALDEFMRVLRPGGEIVLVNHIGAEKGPMAAFETVVAPIAKKLGWRANFPLQRLRDWAASRGFEVHDVDPHGPIHYFTLIRLKDRRADRAPLAA